MAAASSGVEVVVEDRDGSGKESHERKQGVLVGELPDRFSLETPQEGTKEHMNVVERHLDELTFCGSTINDLELQLSSARASFRKTLGECKLRLEETRKRLGSCIPKSQPFIEVWRKARQVQEESNRAAAMFDKASSQYAAAKEMIRVTEGELANSIPETSEEGKVVDESVSHALLEVLNHATRKVVGTEKEKRESEAEHRRVLDRCNAVLEEYRLIERKLRPHIIKSRPYFEERWRSSQELNQLKRHISGLERELQKTKKRYAETLRNLDRLNLSLHRQRRANSLSPIPQQSSEVGGANSDSESVQSWQVVEGVQFTGSTGSLPSIGSSVAEETDEHPHSQPPQDDVSVPAINVVADDDELTQLARDFVHRALRSALTRLANQSS
jgi:chromosome segregation ATPase